MAVLQIHTLTALAFSLSSSFFLIFIIKILFLIFMDFLPGAAAAMTPLKRTYNVLNIEIKKFFKLFLYDMWNYFCNQPQTPLPTPTPTPTALPSSPPNMADLALTNMAPYADALNPTTRPPCQPFSGVRAHKHTHTSHCSCLFAITKWKAAIKVALYKEGS